MITAASPRYANIDALRAVAALFVVWVHASEAFLPVAGSGRWVYDAAIAVNAGRIGVTIFFLVSGFVIPSSLDRDGSRAAIAYTFGVRRFFRLYPAYWLSVPVAAMVSWLVYGLRPDLTILAVNLSMLQDAFGVPSMQWVYWTLQTELVFYGLCVLLLVAGLLRPSAGIALVGLVMLVVFLSGFLSAAEGTWLTDWQLHRLAGNLSLMLLGTLLRRWHDGCLDGSLSRVVAAAIATFWLAGASLLTGDPSYSAALTIFIAGVFLLRSPWPVVTAVGRASYSLYLFHAVLVGLLGWLVGRGSLGGAPLLLYVLGGTVVAIGVAEGLYRAVELPMIALGNRVLARRADSVVASLP